MPEIFILLDGGVRVPAEPGESVLAAILRAGHRLQTVCKGRGMCGACRVSVEDDRLAEPSPSEARLLRYLKQGSANNRLACQILLDENLSGLRITPDPLPVRNIQQENAR